MKRAQVMALIAAHYQRDEPRFRGLVLQIAATIKDYRDRSMLQNYANKPALKALELAPDVRQLVTPLEIRELESLCLTEELKSVFDRVIAEHRARPAFAGTGLEPTCRLLFHGPPGNGKTTAAAALCGQLGLDVYGLALQGVVGSFMGSTAKGIQKALSAMGDGRALVLDELDAIGATRGDEDSTAGTREYNMNVNTLLTLLDREHRGMLVATTNRIDMIDPAIRRRFEVVVEFPAPTGDQRLTLAFHLAKRFQLTLTDELQQLALRCVSFDEVERLLVNAARLEIVRDWEMRQAREGVA